MKLERNDPCWCRSGKKYKKCHLGRADEPRVRKQDALDASRRARKEKTCFHPYASSDACGAVIGAHSIQRSGGGLAAIASKGHVYGYRSDFSLFEKSGGRVMPKLVGVNDASTFTGFCDVHDAELFRALEVSPFHATCEQLALLGFRAICRDLMAKRSALALNPFLKNTGDRGLNVARQVLWQRQMLEHEGGNALAISDLETAKDRLEAAIVSHDYSDVHALVCWFDRTPAMLASSPFTPEFDFDGNVLQDLNDRTITADVLAFSVIGDGNGAGAATFVWTGDRPAVNRFVSSINRIPRDVLPHRLVQFTLECFENAFWSPAWWDGLDEATQTLLIDRMNAQLNWTRPADHLADDGSRSASWTITDIVTI
ncbi:MAG TPA: SEC-C domain-containing protein [Thermoanaerobaculia bacterium]